MQENIDTMKVKAEPIQVQERIEVLDVIRGFALFGILLVNMAWYSSPVLYYELLGKSVQTGIWDTISSSFVNFLVQGKFYLIFSFLFGMGFAIFFERAKSKTSKPILLFYRRLIILLLIGLAHLFFIWYGDILVTYAVLGFLLPLFFNRKPKTLIKWAIWLISILIIVTTIMMGFIELGRMFDENAVNQNLQPFFTQLENGITNSYQAYGQGTFSEIMTQRKSDALFSLNQIFGGIFAIFPIFLIGLYAGKKGIFHNIEANISFIKKTMIWSLIIGITLSVVKFYFKHMMQAEFYSFNTAIHTAAGAIGDLGLCLFFITSIVILYQNKKWILKLKPLANMGRMALSNYLLQSIICTTIFYNYGFGLYGKLGYTLGFTIALAILIIQLFLSNYWFKHFRFGPVEWLWKSLTYGKLKL
ncbi:MAG: DUF418 domain-containing protein [Marinilabiliaceae bacterium]|nr:DUF418 domain-containing protein [Marinilabiliaceae bacterium]